MKQHVTKKAAVLLATWNREKILDIALTSMNASNHHELFDIFVIDNGSADNTEAMIAKHKGVSYMRNTKNNFVCSALNKGFMDNELAKKYKYLILIADDVQVDKNTFYELIKFMDGNPDVGLTAPLQYEYNTDIIRTHGLYINPWTSLLVNFDGDNLKGMNHFSSCYVTRTAIFEKLKGYENTLYPMIYEEPDLGERILKLGYAIEPCLNSKMWHPIELNVNEKKDYITVRKDRIYASVPKSYLFFRNRIIYMSTYSSLMRFIVFYFLFNPLISLYYLWHLDRQYIMYALTGIIDGTVYAVTRSRSYISKRNKKVLGL